MTSTPVTFMLTPRGPFSLAASIRFLEGFTRARYAGSAEPVLRLAFPLDGRWTAVGLRVRQDADGWCTPGHTPPATRPTGMPSGHEPRLRQAVRDAYRLGGDVDDDTLPRITDGWRPYRTWVSLLLRTWRKDETGQISGRRRR